MAQRPVVSGRKGALRTRSRRRGRRSGARRPASPQPAVNAQSARCETRPDRFELTLAPVEGQLGPNRRRPAGSTSVCVDARVAPKERISPRWNCSFALLCLSLVYRLPPGKSPFGTGQIRGILHRNAAGRGISRHRRDGLWDGHLNGAAHDPRVKRLREAKGFAQFFQANQAICGTCHSERMWRTDERGARDIVSPARTPSVT